MVKNFCTQHVNARDSRDDQSRRKNASQSDFVQEIEFGAIHDSRHVQFGDPTLSFEYVENQTRNENRGEHTHQNTENQRDGESFDLLGTNDVQHNRSNQGRNVGVNNCRGRFVKTVSNRHPQRGSSIKFFSDPFKNQHVRVHGHTDRQHEACQSRQRDRLIDRHHQRQDQDQVKQQRDGCHDS